MKSRFSVILIASLVLALTLSACGAVSSLKNVNDVGKAFMDALKANDADTSWNMMTTALQEDLGAQMDWQTYVTSNSFEDYKFNSNSVENDLAILDGEAVINNETYSIQLTFQQENDDWMLVGITFEPK